MNRRVQLFHGNVYIYNEADIGMYLCDTNLKDRVCFVPLDEDDGKSNTIKINTLRKVVFLDDFEEIDRSAIKEPLKLHGANVQVPYTQYLLISEYVLTKLFHKTADTYNKLSHLRFNSIDKENYILTEDYYKYLSWFDFKTKLQFQINLKKQPSIMVRGVYWAELGRNLGSELEKLRPVLVLRKNVSTSNPNLSSYTVIPFTSQDSANKYWSNYQIKVDGKNNYIKINDMQRISIKRIKGAFIKKDGTPLFINEYQMHKVKSLIHRYYVKGEKTQKSATNKQ